MIRIILLTFLLFLFSSFTSFAESPPERSLFFNGDEVHLSFLDKFEINVNDQVSDGCLPNPGAVKDKIEIGLRRNNFQIITDEGINDAFHIIALGYETTKNNCVVYLTSKVEHIVFTSVPYSEDVSDITITVLVTNHEVNSYLLSGKKSTMQERIEDFATKSVDKLFLDISRAQDSIFSDFPELKENWEKSKKVNEDED